ncbi:MAG: hypothetical protein KDC92_06900 [Bacteroidetes bacterium]|nr:hypothetical protein [Bacteroidota bacterium]
MKHPLFLVIVSCILQLNSRAQEVYKYDTWRQFRATLIHNDVLLENPAYFQSDAKWLVGIQRYREYDKLYTTGVKFCSKNWGYGINSEIRNNDYTRFVSIMPTVLRRFRVGEELEMAVGQSIRFRRFNSPVGTGANVWPPEAYLNTNIFQSNSGAWLNYQKFHAGLLYEHTLSVNDRYQNVIKDNSNAGYLQLNMGGSVRPISWLDLHLEAVSWFDGNRLGRSAQIIFELEELIGLGIWWRDGVLNFFGTLTYKNRLEFNLQYTPSRMSYDALALGLNFRI